MATEVDGENDEQGKTGYDKSPGIDYRIDDAHVIDEGRRRSGEPGTTTVMIKAPVDGAVDKTASELNENRSVRYVILSLEVKVLSAVILLKVTRKPRENGSL